MGTDTDTLAPWRVKDWHAADRYLREGRDPNDRRLQNNTRLKRLGNDNIGVLLHKTFVVTYIKGSSDQIIFMGGWNTMTTRDRIDRYSAARLYSPSKKVRHIQGVRIDLTDEVCLWHDSDPVDDPRIWKCRRCDNGVVRAICHGPRSEWRGWGESRHWVEQFVCKHGLSKRHSYESHDCHQCEGTGMHDYGSNPIPTTFDSTDAVLIDATGKALKVGVEAPKFYDARNTYLPRRTLRGGGWR